MDFAPYQDQSPETNRALSPPPEGRRSFSPGVRSPPLASPTTAPKPSANPWAPIEDSSARAFGNDGSGGHGSADLESGRGRLNEFETSLPIRLDYEACLAYLLLPPAGGVLLLVIEHKSDYVRWVLEFENDFERRGDANGNRFHAWQSALLFTAIFVLHLIFSWSAFLSWLLFVGDIGLIGYLTFRAYRDGQDCHSTTTRAVLTFFSQRIHSIDAKSRSLGV